MLTRNRTNPLFAADSFRLLRGEEATERARNDPDSLDLLIWNVFASLETHSDPRWLAGRLQMLGGPAVREPIRISLWTGAERDPLLQPPSSYLAHVRGRAHEVGAEDSSVADFAAPVAVPVRIESPEVLILVEAVWDQPGLGNGGRDRLAELIDVGLEQARRVGKTLALAVVYRSGTPAASELSQRINALRSEKALTTALPHRTSIPPVILREMSWQQLLRIWHSEIEYLDLSGSEVRQFTAHCQERGLL